MQILVASRNAKKLTELRRVLDAAGIRGVELLGLGDVPEYPERPEDGRTFEDNAFIKASDGARYTGLACLADDSGLAVDELNGMPGVLSARWCGRHGEDAANNELLLAQLADVPDERRGAAFVSACVLVVPGAGRDGRDAVHAFRGQWRGRVIREPRGEEGFGYDPIFIPDEEDARVAAGRDIDTLGGAPRTSAELSPQEKDAISHRGRALRQLVPVVAELAG